MPIEQARHISVVVPFYNEQENLPNILSSLIKQTTQNFKVIFVDNDSTDDSRDVIFDFMNKSGFELTLLSENKPGPGNARGTGMNYALEESPNTLLITTDADAILPVNWVTEMSKLFTSDRVGAGGGAHTASVEIDNQIYEKLGIPRYFARIADLNIKLAQNGFGAIKLSGPNAAFAPDAYKLAGGMRQPYRIDGSVGFKEVGDLASRIKQLGFRIAFLPFPIVTSRRRHLAELLMQDDPYYPKSNNSSKRFLCIDTSQEELLEEALETVPKDRWIAYQLKLIDKVLHNTIFRLATNGLLNRELLMISGTDQKRWRDVLLDYLDV